MKNFSEKSERKGKWLSRFFLHFLRNFISRLMLWRAMILVVFSVLLILVFLRKLDVLSAVLSMLIVLIAGGIVYPSPERKLPSVAAMAPSPDRFSAICMVAAAIPDPCLILNRKGRILFQNLPALDILGKAVYGRPVTSFLRAPEFADSIRESVKSVKSAFFQYLMHFPVERSFDVCIAPLHQADSLQRLEGFLLILRDRTEQHHVVRMRTDFIANASHELCSPLEALLEFTKEIRSVSPHDQEERERLLGLMDLETRRMSRLVDDLFLLSRVESGSHIYPETRIDFVQIVRSILDDLKPFAHKEGVELVSHLPDISLFVYGVEDELAQMCQNLIENGVKHGSSGKIVYTEVQTRVDSAGGKKIVFSVRDEGGGILPEHLPRLTERFYRVDAVSSRKKGGTGLGLAIVKHIVIHHHGDLHIESAFGHGALFQVTMDCLEQESRV